MPAQQVLLTIAGFDPSSGAGITADLAVFAAHGFFGTSAITALTVQSTLGVRAVYSTAPEVLAETLDTLSADLPPAGIKIGMLATEGNVHAVAAFLRRLQQQGIDVPVVLDPVLRSSSGRDLLSPAGMDALGSELLPLVTLITPNTAELELLTGLLVRTRAQVELAAANILSRHPALSVIATGGDSFGACDLLSTAAESAWFDGERVESTSTHGTGCAFSSALLCNVVQGIDSVSAVHQAKAYISKAIRSAPGLGHGRGPMNLQRPYLR